jgi:hypothetical protein
LPLRPDGSLGAPVTTITLLASDAAILFKGDALGK